MMEHTIGMVPNVRVNYQLVVNVQTIPIVNHRRAYSAVTIRALWQHVTVIDTIIGMIHAFKNSGTIKVVRHIIFAMIGVDFNVKVLVGVCFKDVIALTIVTFGILST